MRRHSGFTLIEAMIVVTILAIIAVVAFPSYSNYVLRSNRAVAKSAAMRIAGQQESFYTDRKQYATSLADVGAAGFLRRDGNFQAANDGAAIYSVTLGAYSPDTVLNCTVTGAPSTAQYAIKLTPINSQARDTACGSLCLGSPGDKGRSGPATDCWSR